MSTSAGNVPPPRKDDSLRGILGVLLGVLVVALVLIFAGIYFGGRYLARNLHINVRERGEEKSVRIQTPGGEVNIEKREPSTERLGLPIYPGAVRQKEGASLTVRAGEEGGSLMVQKYETPDALDRVAEWYRKELGPDFTVEHERRRGTQGGAIVFQSNRAEEHRLVALKREGNVTQIVLTVVKEKKPV